MAGRSWAEIIAEAARVVGEQRDKIEPLASELADKIERDLGPLFSGMLGDPDSTERTGKTEPPRRTAPKDEPSPDPVRDLFRADRVAPEPAPAESNSTEAVMGLAMLRMEVAKLVGAKEGTEDMMLALMVRQRWQDEQKDAGSGAAGEG